MWWYFSFSHVQGVKIENLAEKKPSLTTVSLSVRGCTSLAAMLIFLLPGVSTETVELRESAVCMIIVDYDGKSQRLCRQIGSDPPPPHNTKICWSWSAIWHSYMWTEPGAPDWQEVSRFSLLLVGGGVLLTRRSRDWCHSGAEFWFCWYMEALSFSRARHRWQLQLPVRETNTVRTGNIQRDHQHDR